MCNKIMVPNFSCYFHRKHFNKRSSEHQQEVEKGALGGGALPSGPLNIKERAATARHSEDLPTVPANANKAAISDKPATADHAPLGAEKKVP